MMLAKSAWNIALSAALEFEERPRKVEQITERWTKYSAEDKRRAFRLLYAWLRGKGLAQAVLATLLSKPPRKKLQLILELACSELLVTETERHPAVVSNAVDIAKVAFSKREAGLCNAVLRKASAALPATDLRFSHPAWLVRRWEAAFGRDNTAKLLHWNQSAPATYVRWSPQAADRPAGLSPSPWPHFYTYEAAERAAVLEAVQDGRAYIQDPFTRYPVEMALQEQPAAILDLCAAPGGKTRALFDNLVDPAKTALVASDLPGPRLEQLKENLEKIAPAHRPVIIGADATELSPKVLAAAGQPTTYNSVLIDVPCSNTGVIQRRPDVRWLLSEAGLAQLLDLQARLLQNAAQFVAPRGRLIYSTCSLETEENENQVAAFLAKNPGFELESQKLSQPWVDNHDGGGAFTLIRND